MEKGTALFMLKSDNAGAYDGSVKGISITQTVNAKVLQNDMGFHLDRGYIELAGNKALEGLQSFTLEATIAPDGVDGARQNIMEAQSPSVALFIEAGGRLVGSVHTSAGWETVDSGSTLIQAGEAVLVRFTRDDSGIMELHINDQVVGSRAVPNPIQNVGTLGFKLGAGIDGQRYPFTGRIAQTLIRSGAVGAAYTVSRQQLAATIEQSLRQSIGNSDIKVVLQLDVSRARLQPVKDLMNAAGVEKLTDLGTLKFTAKTVLSPGKVIIAPRRSKGAIIDWSQIASQLVRVTDVVAKRDNLAKYLVNRNSSSTLRRWLPPVQNTPVPPSPFPRPGFPGGATIPTLPRNGQSIQARGVDAVRRGGMLMPTNVLRENPVLRQTFASTTISELITVNRNAIQLNDLAIIDKLELTKPSEWPSLSEKGAQLYSLKTIPVTSAVIIAHTLDLTETELVVEPNVSTFYIIAEKIICGDQAKITWRRPGGETPPRLANPDLSGRGWSGVNTKPDSRDGVSGDDGRAGEPGIEGAKGAAAPNLEMWVRDMSAMPNLDLNGEDGRKGGLGQRGGNGGDGADGKAGERWWAFGWHCWEDPGDGGEGGDGGPGGRGGRGGNGGAGGNITIGVLDGTLVSTVTSRAFKIKNQGGQRGRGGDGAEGGFPGAGGRSGAGETCKDARNGRSGAQGQRGNPGMDAAYEGLDGSIRFFEFSEDAWEDLLERPWLSEITPTQAFPGDTLTLRGSQFTSHDRVVFGGTVLVPAVNADESLSITIPLDAAGGEKTVCVRREDGTESNRITARVKPQLDAFSAALIPGSTVTLAGRAFLPGASVLVNGAAAPANVLGRTQLSFVMPGTGGAGSIGGNVSLQVRNSDGLVSNSRSASLARVLEIPFKYGVHNLKFGNFSDGVPSWGTYQDTFGAAEIWHEQLDPVFGHPILTAAFYGFYHYFLKGTANGGLATGYCTSLSSVVADNFWQGRTDTPTLTKAGLQQKLTGVHGKLLSRESLIHFHDQGREGAARVEKTCREIEATFLRGCDRDNAPLLFFIPSGEVWDAGYTEKLGSSHCVMPYKFVYPAGHPGPQLSADGTTTVSDLDGVELFVWDCNQPESNQSRLKLKRSGSVYEFEYCSTPGVVTFRSQDGITLGMMTNGQYMLADHDLPFSGPFGLTRFVVDFLLSPADLQITDENGLATGRFGSQLHAGIPDSHPCYLIPGAYLLPENVPLNRKIVGTGAGSYTYNSILPSGLSVVISDVATAVGQEDLLSANADYTQLRFTPGAEKEFTITIARQIEQQVRAVAIQGIGGGPGSGLDITLSPEMSVVRVGNRSSAKTVEVRAFTIDQASQTPQNDKVEAVHLPTSHDLVIAVPDWTALDLHVQAISFS